MPKKRKKEKKMEATSLNATFAIFAKADGNEIYRKKSEDFIMCIV